jgi:hypothetical protein
VELIGLQVVVAVDRTKLFLQQQLVAMVAVDHKLQIMVWLELPILVAVVDLE